MDLNLQIKPSPDDALFASYTCPCGCNPSVAYAKGTSEAVDGCCCGNEFAVGPGASHRLQASDGFILQVDRFAAPWGESLEAAWRLGPSKHGEAGQEHDHDHDHQSDGASGSSSAQPGTAIDPAT